VFLVIVLRLICVRFVVSTSEDVRTAVFWYVMMVAIIIIIIIGAGIAQSVQRLATGWTTEGSEFESRWGQEFSLLHVVQTGSGVHPTSYPMGTGGKAAGA
jgi:hypothetical protein